MHLLYLTGSTTSPLQLQASSPPTIPHQGFFFCRETPAIRLSIDQTNFNLSQTREAGTMEANEDAQVPGVGRLRPESSASSHSRLTPQSSNNSSANLQHRSQSGMRDRGHLQDGPPGTRRVSPGSSLLQERLKEKKVARLSERHQSADGNMLPDEAGAKGSPQLGAGNRPARDREGRPGSSGGRPLPLGKKPMGLKEMEEVGV